MLQPSTFILHIIGSEKFFIYIKHLHKNNICYFLVDYYCFADWKSFWNVVRGQSQMSVKICTTGEKEMVFLIKKEKKSTKKISYLPKQWHSRVCEKTRLLIDKNVFLFPFKLVGAETILKIEKVVFFLKTMTKKGEVTECSM